MAAQPETLSVGVVHGPNLNLLGRREPATYGTASLAEIDAALGRAAQRRNTNVVCFQSNGEGALVDFIHEQAERVHGFLVNAGAYTHTSIALRDAFAAVQRPFVEVHLSNVYAREPFRHHSFLAPLAVGVVSGFGPNSYLLGLHALVDYLRGDRDVPRDEYP